VDEVLAVVSGTTRTYVHSNHLYSPAALTSSTGAVVERYRYDAYGMRTVTNAAGVPRTPNASQHGFQRGFTGYHLDEETGLYYARARMYSPGLGRFIGRDPKGYVDGMGLYSGYFVPNALDPDGTKTAGCCCCCPEKIGISQLAKIAAGGLFGHSFKIDLTMIYHESDTPISDGECELEWDEWTTRTYIGNNKTKAWTNVYPTGAGTSGSSTQPWRDHIQDTHCYDDPKVVSLPDSPKVAAPMIGKKDPAQNGSRTLFIRIKLKANEACKSKCSKSEVTLTVKQTLTDDPAVPGALSAHDFEDPATGVPP